jgi:hypothetical protein
MGGRSKGTSDAVRDKLLTILKSVELKKQMPNKKMDAIYQVSIPEIPHDFKPDDCDWYKNYQKGLNWKILS